MSEPCIVCGNNKIAIHPLQRKCHICLNGKELTPSKKRKNSLFNWRR